MARTSSTKSGNEGDTTNWDRVVSSLPLALFMHSPRAGVGGSTSDMRQVEGKYLTVEMGNPSPSTDPECVVQLEEHLASGTPGKLALRSTLRSEYSGTYTQKFWLYNWDTTTWDQVGSSLPLPLFMQSPRAVVSGWSTIDHYVDQGNGGLIRAQITVKKSGITPVNNPDMSFEQFRLLKQ